jgi:flagellar biosynthesis/type III secretory pathway protein FliH
MMAREKGEAETEVTSGGEERSGEPVRVLEAPVEMAEPLAEVIDGESCRVIKHETVSRIEGLNAAIERAEQRAERIVDEAREKADAIREEAREAGRREGYEELVDLIAEVRERYRTIQDEARQDTLELAFRVARRIVGREIDQQPEIVREMVADSLRHVRGKRQVVVYVHPDDLPYLTAEKEELSRRLDGATIYFEGSAEIEQGGCLIETATERVDARLEMQIEQLRDAITNSSC